MHTLKHIYNIIKSFLSDFSGKEFLIFLFFLALSGVFWLMMTLNETYEVEFKVPLVVSGVPKNVVMTSEPSDTVRVSLKDKGYVIMIYTTYQKLRPLVVKFSTYADKQTGQGEIPTTDLIRMVRQQIFGSTSITALKCDQLTFSFNYGQNKRLKIELTGNIVPTDNYYLAHVQITPEYATVYASRQVLSKLQTVLTEALDISNFNDTVTRVVSLRSIAGAKVVPAKVRVTLYPDVLTEGSVDVPITTINKPESLVVRTFPQTVKVKYNVGANLYRFVHPSDFVVNVDYREIAAHPSDKCNLYLHSNSRFARNARLENSQVDYLIEQQ